MESLLNMAKRKKRKSRKCLDEIRKRSRQTGQILFEKDNGKVCNLFTNYINVNNCVITNNRLTLRMIPKAVQSETITRPTLADLKQTQKLNLDELVKGTKVLTTLNSTRVTLPELFTDRFDNNVEHFNNENVKFIANKCALEDSVNDEDLVVKNINGQEEKLSSNFDLLTSMDSNEMTDKSPDSIGAQSVSTLTTSSNQSLHSDFGYNQYEEFMSEIPTYLKQNATFVEEEEVMTKTKVFLQNLFIESCYQECEDKVLKCIKNNTAKNVNYTPSEMIVHNPMDYIRLGHVEQQSLFHQSSRIRGPIVRSCSTPQSPLIALSSPAVSPDTPLSVIAHETPDYTFYPHTLN